MNYVVMWKSRWSYAFSSLPSLEESGILDSYALCEYIQLFLQYCGVAALRRLTGMIHLLQD